MTDLTTPTKTTNFQKPQDQNAQGDAASENSKSLIQDLSSPLTFIYKKLSTAKNEKNEEKTTDSKTEEQRANRALRAMRREQEKREKLAQDKLAAGNFNRRKSYQPTQTVPKSKTNLESGDSPNVIAKIPQKMTPQYNHQLPTKKTSSISIKSGSTIKRLSYVPKANTPNTKQVQSKVGSLTNLKHTPKGGDVKIFDQGAAALRENLKKSATSKIASLDNVNYSPASTAKPILDKSKEDREHLKKVAKSKCGSLANINHTPKQSDLKIFDRKLRFNQQATSKCGSLQNIKHKPGGGDIKIVSKTEKYEKVTSKCGSLANKDYVPKNTGKKIFSEKLDYKNVKARAGSLANIGHKPKASNVVIFDESTIEGKRLAAEALAQQMEGLGVEE